MFGTGHLPPKGWTVDGGRLEEVPTVAGYAARRCGVFGRCQRQDCRRTCHLDYERLMRAGMGALPVRQVTRSLLCNRLDGCSLDFREEPERIVRIGELAGRDYVGVQIRCSQCGAKYLTTVEGLIHRLNAAKQGDAATPAKGVGALIRGPCSTCKAARWEVSFLWCDPNAHRPPIWKQDLQKRIDEAQRRRDVEAGLVT